MYALFAESAFVANATGHMDKGLACYGASCTVFETLISPVYNVKLDDNRSRSSDGTAITDANAPVALQAARNAIKNPYTITDMSQY